MILIHIGCFKVIVVFFFLLLENTQNVTFFKVSNRVSTKMEHLYIINPKKNLPNSRTSMTSAFGSCKQHDITI